MSKRVQKRKREDANDDAERIERPLPATESLMQEMSLYVFRRIKAHSKADFSLIPKALWAYHFFLSGPMLTHGHSIQTPLVLAAKCRLLESIVPHIPREPSFMLDGGLAHQLPHVLLEIERQSPSDIIHLAPLFSDRCALYRDERTVALMLHQYLQHGHYIEYTDRLLGVRGSMLDPDASFCVPHDSRRAFIESVRGPRPVVCALDLLLCVCALMFREEIVEIDTIDRVDHVLATLCANLPSLGVIHISDAPSFGRWTALKVLLDAMPPREGRYRDVQTRIYVSLISKLFWHLDNCGWLDDIPPDVLGRTLVRAPHGAAILHLPPSLGARPVEPLIERICAMIVPRKRAHLRDRYPQFECSANLVTHAFSQMWHTGQARKTWLAFHPLCIWQTWRTDQPRARALAIAYAEPIVKYIDTHCTFVAADPGRPSWCGFVWTPEIYGTYLQNPIEPLIRESIKRSQVLSENPCDRSLWLRTVPHTVVQSTPLQTRGYWAASGDALCMHHKFARGPGPGAHGHAINAQWCLDAAWHFCGGSIYLDYHNAAVHDGMRHQIRRLVHWGYPESALMKRTHAAWAELFRREHDAPELQYLNHIGDTALLIWGYVMLAEMYDWTLATRRCHTEHVEDIGTDDTENVEVISSDDTETWSDSDSDTWTDTSP